MKVNFFYNYPIHIDIETDKNVEVYIDQFNLSEVPTDCIRIVILEEPAKREVFSLVKKYPDCYTYVMTFQEELLATNPKARILHFPNAWVRGYVSPQKRFSVSTIVGGKTDPAMSGYELRHELWRNKNLVVSPKDFYLSSASNPHYLEVIPRLDDTGVKILGSSKEPLFDSMFHVAIENCSIEHYFSEKIIDCFQSKTIPIYYGCTNIDKYFNTEGIIIVHSLSEIIDACNRITPDLYYNMLPAMEDNLNRSHEWSDGLSRLKIELIKLLNEI